MELENLTKKDLYELAKNLNIKNRSKMTKDELMEAISEQARENLIEKSSTKPEIHHYHVGYTETATFKKEEKVEDKDKPIPDRYNIDYIYLLAVNPSTVHIFWEITDNTIKYISLNFNVVIDGIQIKIYADDVEIGRIPIDQFGNYYFNSEQLKGKEIWAEVGATSGNEFYSIAITKRINMPRDYISSEEDVTYMTVKEQMEKLILFSLSEGDVAPSSEEYIKKVLKSISSSRKG
jgi:hypothetical protein